MFKFLIGSNPNSKRSRAVLALAALAMALSPTQALSNSIDGSSIISDGFKVADYSSLSGIFQANNSQDQYKAQVQTLYDFATSPIATKVDVEALQEKLGFKGRDLDGVMGAKTKQAFQNILSPVPTLYTVGYTQVNNYGAQQVEYKIGYNVGFAFSSDPEGKHVNQSSTMKWRWGREHMGGDFTYKPNGSNQTLGQTLKVVSDSTVLFSGSITGGGKNNVILFDHDQCAVYTYMHNKKSFVHTGQELKKGDLFAMAGNEGKSQAPHVHWESAVYDGKYFVNIAPRVSQEIQSMGLSTCDDQVRKDAIAKTRVTVNFSNIKKSHAMINSRVNNLYAITDAKNREARHIKLALNTQVKSFNATQVAFIHASLVPVSAQAFDIGLNQNPYSLSAPTFRSHRKIL